MPHRPNWTRPPVRSVLSPPTVEDASVWDHVFVPKTYLWPRGVAVAAALVTTSRHQPSEFVKLMFVERSAAAET